MPQYRPTTSGAPSRAVIAVLACLFVGVGCNSSAEKPSQKPPPIVLSEPPSQAAAAEKAISAKLHFEELANASGIVWRSYNGEEAQRYSILETLGVGCATTDYDQDGQLDIVVMGGGEFAGERELAAKPMALFRQLSAWRFEPVQEPAGLPRPRFYHHGSFTADHDNDGFPDLLITGYGGLQLLRNQGDGTFMDQTGASGLIDTLWSSAAAWADLNDDGVLDLFVGHYVDWSFDNNPICHSSSLSDLDICGPPTFGGLPCSFFLSNADGTFRDASHELGFDLIGKVLGVVIADFDHDRSLEVYVANDADQNHLYRRQPDGKYLEQGLISGVALGDLGEYDGSMGVDAGDIDGDGRVDLWVANFENQSFAFYRNMGKQLFQHASRMWGLNSLGRVSVGFGTVLFDADGDGHLDIFCANGHVYRGRSMDDRTQLPFLLWSDHGKHFYNVASRAGEYFQQKHLGRGVACGDLDRNGTLDLVITHLNSDVAVLRNDSPVAHWLSIKLIGSDSCRDAIGAEVTIDTGGRRRMSVVTGGGSFLSTSEKVVYFGLADSEQVERLEVRWPRGRTDMLLNVPVDQRLILIEGSHPSSSRGESNE